MIGPEIISRQQAKARGLTHYATGKPCSRGHVGLRYVSTRQCIKCREPGSPYAEAQHQRRRLARLANPEKFRQYERAKRAADPEKYRELVQKYRTADPQRYRQYSRDAYAADPEKYRLYARKYRAADPQKYRDRDRTRRTESLVRRFLEWLKQSRLKPATPPWVDRTQLLVFWRNRPPGHHIDHIVPLRAITPEGYRVSGLNVLWNLQYLPAGENARKWNRLHHVTSDGLALPSVYLPRQPLP
jgi:hypothetical protein